MVRPVADVLAADVVLGGRYRLERPVGPGLAAAGTALWRAQDLTLSRVVAIRTVVGADVAVRTALFDAAARGGSIHHPAIAPTYDAAEERVGGTPVAYLVREWVDGRSLRREIADGIDAGRLGPLLVATAEAVAAVHAAGCWHGRVHPDNLIVLPDGGVRLTDPGCGVALAAVGMGRRDGDSRDAADTGPPPLPVAVATDLGLRRRPVSLEAGDAAELRRYDVADLGRVVYAAATGSWVGGAWRGLPGAPTDGQRPRRPRQVRQLPRDLDEVVARTLLPDTTREPPLRDAAAIADALGRMTTVDRVSDRTLSKAAGADEREAAGPGRRRRRRLLAGSALVVALLVLAAVGYGVGRRVGTVPGSGQAVATTSAPPTSRGVAPAATIPLSAVRAFDPPPGDGVENDDEVPLAYDGSTATAWQTERYSTATFGGLKPGVGLLVDLGSDREVSTVQVATVGGTTGVQLRAADSPSTTLAGFPVLATGTGTTVTVTVTANARHRYWLVWLTSLPATGGGYRGGIAELVFRS